MKEVKVKFVEERAISSVYYGCYTTMYGEVVFFCTQNAICGLHFLIDSLDTYIALTNKKFMGATLTYDPLLGKKWWERISGGGVIDVILKGTLFEKKIWRGLCKIPWGQTVSYEELAITLGLKKSSARAVGSAVAKNFIGWLIPCHRVVGKRGNLSGYRWGTNKKCFLLSIEKR